MLEAEDQVVEETVAVDDDEVLLLLYFKSYFIFAFHLILNKNRNYIAKWS